MIQIRKTKNGQFFVRAVGRNGEVIHNSESLKKKDSAWKNIRAAAIMYGSGDNPFEVRDMTAKKPDEYLCYMMENEFVKVKVANIPAGKQTKTR
jgi:uncharacterized protein YegP (UPF0339 family)